VRGDPATSSLRLHEHPTVNSSRDPRVLSA
jgi:hypothetical protein